MERYFITPNKREALDVNAHNGEEQEIFKHPYKDEWAVRVLLNNKYIKAKLTGRVVELLPCDWIE